MPNQHSRRQKKPLYYLLLSLICVAMAACSIKNPTTSATEIPSSPTPTADSEATSAIPIIPTLEPSSTAESILTPAPVIYNAGSNAALGLIVISKGDGLFSHLFVYGPDSTPLTRITDDNWDDIDPSLSPDRSKIAFASNRTGEWDIYVLDLKTGETQQMTQSTAYDGNPGWSPDGEYLIYQTLNGSNLDLIILAVNDLSNAPIQLTADSGDNYDAAWSPDGHTVAFVTNRNSQSELWLADLQNIDERFSTLEAAAQTEYSTPSWSPDGQTLAWCQHDSESRIMTLSMSAKDSPPKEIGLGCDPVWSADGSMILANLQQPNSNYLVAYNIQNKTLQLTPVEFDSQIQSFDWASAGQENNLAAYTKTQTLPSPTALYSPTLTLPLSTTGRKGIVDLTDVTVPQAYLADSADEAFYALRKGIGQKIGWDFLASLENAYLPLTDLPSPGITQNWLYTGRAIDVNTIPIDAGWMTVTREDYSGETYWRVWLKCLNQDGSCGIPLHTASWDFSSRFDSEPEAYENGGKYISIQDGYWVDFTEFANRYGWERVPSQANWRYYYPGILFNQFIYSEGLTWSDAMLELYPADMVEPLNSAR